MPSKPKVAATNQLWLRLLTLYSGLFFTWSLYRLLFQNSIWLEEILIKGVIFSLPLFLVPLKAKEPLKAIGMTSGNFFQSVYLGITVGLILGLVGQIGNLIRHGAIIFQNHNFNSAKIGAFLILSLITAFWEQSLFSGYILQHVAQITKSELIQVSLVGVLFSLIHLPVIWFVQQASLPQLVLSLGLLFTLGVSCAILRLRQSNLIAPIMAHALWGVTIFLFR